MLDYIFKEKLYRVTPAKVFRYLKNRYLFQNFDMPPIIIGGSPRSGTTLLLSVLGAHPHIHAVATETQAFSLVRKHTSTAQNHLENIAKFKRFIFLERIKDTAKGWCEKTPNNIHHLDHIFQEFNGKVKVIHIVRDGRDVITSRHPTKPNEYWVGPDVWVKNVLDGLMHNDRDNVHLIRYEDLVGNYQETVDKLLRFLGLEWHEALAKFETNTSVKKNVAYDGGGVKGIHNTSVEKWRKPEHADVVKAFYEDEQAVALMKQLGYEL